MNLPKKFQSYIQHDDDCWIWAGSFHHGVPSYGKGSKNARRIAYEAFTGTKLGRKVVTFQCGDSRCINPEHTKVVTRAGLLKESRKRGSMVFGAEWRAKVTVGRRRNSELTMERVREMRQAKEAGELGVSIADRFGVSRPQTYKILSGECWKEPRSELAMLVGQML